MGFVRNDMSQICASLFNDRFKDLMLTKTIGINLYFHFFDVFSDVFFFAL